MLVNRADSMAAYKRFIQRVLKNKSVWLLVDSENDLPAVCASQNRAGAHVVPIWSDRSYAVRAQPLFPSGTKIESVPLLNFVERTIPFLADQGDLVGPNWKFNLTGLEIDPSEILEKFQHIE